jgi:hypothetical protein
MNRMHLVAFAAAFGIVACDRAPERASVTTTTSACAPAALSAEACDGGQQSQVGHSGHAAYDTSGDEARDGGHPALSELTGAKDAGPTQVSR